MSITPRRVKPRGTNYMGIILCRETLGNTLRVVISIGQTPEQ